MICTVSGSVGSDFEIVFYQLMKSDSFTVFTLPGFDQWWIFFCRYLPPEIGCLNNLEYLDLSFNKLKTLPSEISCLNALISLKVANNKLVELPSGLSSLQRLEVLDLSNNRLTSLGSLELGSMQKLQNINLQVPYLWFLVSVNDASNGLSSTLSCLVLSIEFFSNSIFFCLLGLIACLLLDVICFLKMKNKKSIIATFKEVISLFTTTIWLF